MNSDHGKRVAIYARVSDDKKKDDGARRQDVNRQLELLREHLRLKGIVEWEEYVDDGKSAFKEDWNQRVAFKRLYDECLQFRVKEIYLEDMTRFSRRLELGLQWLRKFSRCDVNIISIREGEIEVTSNDGWMKSSFLLLMIEWQSRILSDKVRSGMQRAKLAGKQTGRPKKTRKRAKKGEV